ncbi:MAG: DUF1428 domain-containing protein [Flavobacteriaceae bacterium]
MSYVDGFVVPVKKAKREDYRKLAELAATVWMEHGALGYVEAEADDVPVGEVTSFTRAVKLEDDETVWFSWILYESREHRDAVNAKVMADARLKGKMEDMPFEGKRLIYGGFAPVVVRGAAAA